MAKIRQIKPITTTDEKLAEVSRDAELLFVLSLMFVDDAGRMEYSPKRLKMQIFPSKRDIDMEIEPLVEELCKQGCFHRYEVNGRNFLCIPNFLKHQRVHKPTPSTLPEPLSVPHGTRGEKREKPGEPGNVGEKCEELEVELEREVVSFTRPENSDFVVEQIFRNYPNNDVRARGRVLHMPPVDESAIIGAIHRHGVDCVLEGTRCYAKAVSHWPPGERQKIFGTAKFYDHQKYLNGPEDWVKTNGNQQDGTKKRFYGDGIRAKPPAERGAPDPNCPKCNGAGEHLFRDTRRLIECDCVIKIPTPERELGVSRPS